VTGTVDPRGDPIGSDGTPDTDLLALCQQRESWRGKRERVAFTNGCFDLLHTGHLTLLERARAAADHLIVGINSDASVRALKGPRRPVLPSAERAEALLALEPVDRVVVYGDPTPLALIEALLPDVLVKGADWPLDQIVGREVVEEMGGSVLRVEILPNRSTTRLIDQMSRA
jgi:D-beta-D-heptose 7-phosphate kinase/D-beta-D-heptose 1-phosphate adenosyltransferase